MPSFNYNVIFKSCIYHYLSLASTWVACINWLCWGM